MAIKIKPITPALGADIIGADLRRDDHFETIRNAFIEHSVIAIRDQDVSPDDHLTFARRWGEINVNRFFKAHETFPEIALVLKEPDQTAAIGEEWHTDHSYDHIPAMGSILRAVETPFVGGDTLFVSMYAAWGALSEPFREMLDGLNAWHSSRHVFGASQQTSESHISGRIGNEDAAVQDALHPVVITHPLSGRRGLYVNPQFTTRIDGWYEEESRALLDCLYRHCSKPEFSCRLRWEPGTVGMWDNRATWHKAINDYTGHRRLMHRVTIEGVALA